MAYSIKGVITKASEEYPEELKNMFTGSVKEFFEPFHGFYDSIDELDERKLLNNSIKIPKHKFIFIQYETWAGKIDYVSGFSFQNGNKDQGTVEEGEEEMAELVFKKLLSYIGYNLKDIYFAPFERNNQ